MGKKRRDSGLKWSICMLKGLKTVQRERPGVCMSVRPSVVRDEGSDRNRRDSATRKNKTK